MQWPIHNVNFQLMGKKYWFWYKLIISNRFVSIFNHCVPYQYLSSLFWCLVYFDLLLNLFAVYKINWNQFWSCFYRFFYFCTEFFLSFPAEIIKLFCLSWTATEVIRGFNKISVADPEWFIPDLDPALNFPSSGSNLF